MLHVPLLHGDLVFQINAAVLKATNTYTCTVPKSRY